MNQNEKNRKSLWLIIAIAASVMVVIVIDINTPRGLADGVLYVLPVGLSLWLPWRRATPIIASVSVLLVIIGFLVSPPSPSPLIFVLLNRGFSVLAITVLLIVGSSSRVADYIALVLQKKATEETLKEAEARYQALLKLGGKTGEAIVMIQDTKEREGCQVYCNSAWPLLTSYPEDELLKISFFDLIHPEYRESCVKLYRREIRGETVSPGLFEMDIIKKGGNVVPTEVTCGWTTYRGKRATAAYIRDITQRKQAENEMRKLSKAVEATADIVFITDNQGIFEYVNSSFEAATGYKREELVGITPRILKSGKQDDNYYKRLWETILAGGVMRAEVVNRKKNGELFHVEQTVTPIKDRAGNVTHFVSTNKDITERKKAEEQIRLQAELLDIATDSVDLHDFEGNFLYVNKAASNTLGYTKEELLKMKINQLDDQESQEKAPARLKELTEKGKLTFTVNRCHKNGFWIPLEVHALHIDNIGGRSLIMSVAHDITERRKMQEQLIAQDRLASIGQMVSGVAHEINNPLTGVIGFSGLVLERKDLQDDMRRDMEIVHNEAQRISGIVKGLLTFARKQGTEKGPVNIHSIIQGVLQLRSYEQRVNNIEVDTRIAPDGPRVLGNGPQLQQVFLNIIINAEQAMFEAHKRGRITVTTEEAGDLVRISFADDGPGISPESMQKLFTPFFTTKEVGKGTGLGLSICHGIMTEHGGRIYAESEPGKGATFIVELPVKQTTTAHEVSE